MSDIAERVRGAFVAACRLDIEVRKPGNVSVASPGHGMQAQQFVSSALAAAGPIAAPRVPVGRRIEEAVRASWVAAGCNTNLGIVLLAAPLAAAAEQVEQAGASGHIEALRGALRAVLVSLDLDDARAAYRAIALANPGGLGDAGADDVRREPRVTLLDAMRVAAPRDSIARQYANGFADVLDAAAELAASGPRTAAADRAGPDAPQPADASSVQRTFLRFLARWPDSHIVRKHGDAVAQNVMVAAQGWLGRDRPADDPGFAAWDESLKRAGLNPGTSADLTVAALFAAGLAAPTWHGS